MRKFAEAYPDFQIVQTLSAQLSWSHHILILDKFKEEKLRFWYLLKSAEQAWSYRILQHQIDMEIHTKFGTLPNNFESYLPKPQSELLQQLFKDEYIFDFIAQDEKRKEKDFEKEITQNITDFLLTFQNAKWLRAEQENLTPEKAVNPYTDVDRLLEILLKNC